MDDLAMKLGAVLVLHTSIIKYIFEIYLGIICIAVGKNGNENMEGFKNGSAQHCCRHPVV